MVKQPFSEGGDFEGSSPSLPTKHPHVPIPYSKVEEMLGNRVHVMGWPGACQFYLTDIVDDDYVFVEPPVKRRKYKVHKNRLLYTRKNAPKDEEAKFKQQHQEQMDEIDYLTS